MSRYDSSTIYAAATMALFVHEYFSSGAYEGDLRQTSLAREGLLMLGAVLEDFADCTADRVVTTLDRRLAALAPARCLVTWSGLRRPDIHWFDIHRFDIQWADSPGHEALLFQKLAAEAKATFVIAPESDGILLARRRLVERAGGRFLGHSAEAIRLCSDKLAFCEHLRRHELPTIPTELFDLATAESSFPYPVVVKPRDGAGSEDTFLIRSEEHLRTLRRALNTAFGERKREAIVQPFVRGQSLSVAAIVDGDDVEVFPVAEQCLSDDGRFHYKGGRIPEPAPPICALELPGMTRRVCRSISGLAGYIGVDLILSADAPQLVIVEANPRLTTSYLGYRALAMENLAARMLDPARNANPIKWKAGTIEFNAGDLPGGGAH